MLWKCEEADKRTLEDACAGADVFVGLSGADLLSPDVLNSMAEKPVIFACSNPDPEIDPKRCSVLVCF